MTAAQLAEELENKRDVIGSVLSEPTFALDPVTVSAQAPAPVVLTGKATAPETEPVDMNLRTPQPLAPVQEDAPVQAPDGVDRPESFYDLILQNDAYRLQNKEAFDRREKANKARTTIAAVSDALASLGNLVGTTHGAFSQPQTYSTPFVAEQVAQDRARARQMADYLQRNDQSLRLAQAREEAANGAAALRRELEEERTRRAQMNNLARAALSAQNASQKADLYGVQHGYRSEEEEQKQGNRMELQDSRNKQSDTNNRRTTATSRANTKNRIAAQQANGGGGRVGGYTTETTIHRDEYGQETGRTTTRTPANGGASTTTTTTTTTERKPNPMGSAPKPEGKKKKKNPMA